MSTESTFIIEVLKTIGPAGAASVGTAYVFLKYYNKNGNSNNKKDAYPCPLHKGIADSQTSLFAKIDNLQKEVSELPLKIWQLIQREK